MASEPAEQKVQAATPWSKAVGWAFAWAGAATCLLLCGLYIFQGDTTPLGEAFTTAPPIAWLAPLALFLIPILLARSWRAFTIFGFCLLMLVALDDWQSLFRRIPAMERKFGTRVVTWNTAGNSDWQSVLADLEGLRADIVFLQETPDGNASLTTESLTGYWHGFSWWDQGDCGILSRYPLAPFQSERIGPWDKPALATVEIPSLGDTTSTTVLVSSVRLMMPVNVTQPGKIPVIKDHESRIKQYSALATLLKTSKHTTGAGAIIIGGDFNVRGKSASLSTLNDAGLEDAWNDAGGGWGGTILTDFPVARIDQIWTSTELRPLIARTAEGRGSDHRLVVCDLALH